MEEPPKPKKCKRCNEEIYGLTEKDLKYKMLMHSLKHNKEEEEKK